MPLTVHEIFYSIQGESSFAGHRCVFVRLTGCNLRCVYCDTRYAYEGGQEMSLKEIIRVVGSYACPLVEVTGGEPLIQEDTPRLVDLLAERGFAVLVETNGSLDIRRLGAGCLRIVDMKCPSSGESERNDLENLNRLRHGDELKFVIGDGEDYAYAVEMVRRLPKPFKEAGIIHFSPVFDRMALKTLAEWILRDRLDVRLHLQLHKLVWSPTQRGV